MIAAFDYILKRSAGLNIRVVNLSVATRVDESYNTDPLTVAAKQLVDAGIVVVAAAGNLGRMADGHDAYGGITRARQRAVGPDGRCVEPHGIGGARRRPDGGVQLARTDVARLAREARFVAPEWELNRSAHRTARSTGHSRPTC